MPLPKHPTTVSEKKTAMDAASATSIIGELGYVIPTGLTGFMLIVFIMYIKWQENRQDKDRAEHMAKWNSVIDIQKESMQKMIDAHQRQTDDLVGAHQREMDRQFKLSERNASALEALTHHMSILIKEKTL